MIPKQNWPNLKFSEIQNTLETLHQWIQIVGKIRLETMPWQNHSWHTTLYVTPRGYSTQSIPYLGRSFQLEFDFIQHKLLISTSDNQFSSLLLVPRTVADFYTELFEKLRDLNIPVKINGRPNELVVAIPFAENTTNKSYDPKATYDIWQAMLKTSAVFTQFRSDFIGKCSPVHLFWGAFDLSVTRFSGKPAPLYQGSIPNMPLKVMQEAYSQEVSSAGFWLGSKDSPIPVFYSYAYPSKPNFGKQKVSPEEAFYSEDMGEFFLKYDDVQKSKNPEKMLYNFLQTTYEAAVNSAKWDRSNIERKL